MADGRNFIIASNAPTDKIVWMSEGVFNDTNPYWNKGELPYAKSLYIPVETLDSLDNVLIDGIWTDDDWESAYSLSTWKYYNSVQTEGGTYTTSSVTTRCVPYDNNHLLLMFSSSTLDTSNIKYRIWAYLPEDEYTNLVSETTSGLQVSDLQKNTELNYTKIYADITIKADKTEETVYTHNLGYRPFIICWVSFKETNNLYWFRNGTYFRGENIFVDETKIVLPPIDDDIDWYFHLRIYYDEC